MVVIGDPQANDDHDDGNDHISLTLASLGLGGVVGVPQGNRESFPRPSPLTPAPLPAGGARAEHTRNPLPLFACFVVFHPAKRNIAVLSWVLALLIPTITIALAPTEASLAGPERSAADLVISPDLETTPVSSPDDAADDLAIWVDKASPSASLIVATDKKDGLLLYDLKGRLLHKLSLGRLNNVDLRQDLALGPWRGDLIAATDRSYERVVFLELDRRHRRLKPFGFAAAGVARPYGLCLYQGPFGTQVFVTGKDGDLHQMRVLTVQPKQGVVTRPLATIKLPSQIEGCVADDQTGTLYVGEEGRGIWRMPIRDLSARELVAEVGDASGLRADVEGLAIYRQDAETAFLIASSQGDDAFVLFRLNGWPEPLGKIRIVADQAAGIDGVSETDGLEVTPFALGPDFPDGLLVVQDGHNEQPVENQNFKLLDWRKLRPLY